MTSSQQPSEKAQISSTENTADGSDLRVQRLITIGEMTAGLMHDIRNLLAAVASGIHLAGRSSSLNDARCYLQAALDGVARANELTSHVLTFAVHDSEELRFANITDLVSDLLPLLKCAAGANVSIATKLESDLPMCRTQVRNFQKALLNLVINARDAQPRDGVIRITTDSHEADVETNNKNKASVVRVTVQDHGCGISPTVMGRVFTPFFTTKGKTGSGLGLPQVRAFMQSVQGRLEISSDTSLGTRVHLIFAAGQDLS